MQRSRPIHIAAPGEEALPRRCDAPDCPGEGLYRAPKARDRLNEYWWFCLAHVRDYNRMWDYYAGMTADEIEAHVRFDTTWQRPSWPMGDWRAREHSLRDAARAARAGFEGERAAERPRRAAPASPEAEALAVFDLTPPVGFDRIKARYKELVKRHHPDVNPGDPHAEERLKTINRAYTVLKASYGS